MHDAECVGHGEENQDKKHDVAETLYETRPEMRLGFFFFGEWPHDTCIAMCNDKGLSMHIAV